MYSASAVFHQQNGDVTRAFYEELSGKGLLGQIAVCLFRAQKRSSRAKDYRRGKWRAAAYDVKSWSIDQLCGCLTLHALEFGITWGWKEDLDVLFGNSASWVLYCDLPKIGQVSFHSPNRGEGPNYPGTWDGQKLSEERIIQFADQVMTESVRTKAETVEQLQLWSTPSAAVVSIADSDHRR